MREQWSTSAQHWLVNNYSGEAPTGNAPGLDAIIGRTVPIIPMNNSAPDPRVEFSIRLATALHRYGTPAHRLELMMNMAMRRLGLEGQFFALPTGIFASFGTPQEHRTSLIRTDMSEVDLERMSLLDELAENVSSGQIGPEEGTDVIEKIVAAPPRYPAWLTVLCFSISSATATRFFGGGWRELVAAGAIGTVIGILAILLGKSENTRRVFEIIAAIVAAMLAALAAYLFSPFSIYVTTLASLIILLPGLTLTTGMTELATGNLVSGTARLTGAVLVLLGLAFGAALGGQIAALLPAVRGSGTPVSLPAWTLWLLLLTTPITFAVLLKARPSDIPWAALGCLLSFIGSRAGAAGLGPPLGAFMGAILLGVGANIFMLLKKRPSAVPMLPGLILLVPGSIGFGSMSKFIQDDVIAGLEGAFNVALVAVALVTGLLMANVIVPPRRAL